jgi:hypothetical protein
MDRIEEAQSVHCYEILDEETGGRGLEAANGAWVSPLVDRWEELPRAHTKISAIG